VPAAHAAQHAKPPEGGGGGDGRARERRGAGPARGALLPAARHPGGGDAACGVGGCVGVGVGVMGW
jgi:hypothetical protein